MLVTKKNSIKYYMSLDSNIGEEKLQMNYSIIVLSL